MGLATRLGFGNALFAIFLVAGQVLAQPFPSKPIQLVLPGSPGGGIDVVARLLAKKLGESSGWQITVQNRTGAGGIIAAEFVAKAAADGYTLLLSDTGLLAVNPNIYSKLPYDPLKDFTPVMLAASPAFFLVSNAALPVQSVKELVDYVKANPGLPFGTQGTGSQPHMAMELFNSLAGLRMTHVPYKGTGESVPALVRGDIKAMFITLAPVRSYVQAGTLRVLAVGTPKRSTVMPEVPTIAESGLPGYDFSGSIGFVAPAGTSRNLIDRINGEFARALATPEVAQRLVAFGFEPVGSTPGEYAEAIRAEIRLFGKLVKGTKGSME